jgi:protein arginine kinase activator
MECQECHQRPASLHFTKIINGEKTEMHLCEQCAKEKGDVLPGPNSFSIHNLLSGLLNFDQSVNEAQQSSFNQPQTPYCSKCNMTYQQFAKIGRFGCSHCYKAFDHKLNPVLKKVHGGNTIHSGKIPKRGGYDLQRQKKILELRTLMKTYIGNEEFEKAAEIRDEIRRLENSESNKEG